MEINNIFIPSLYSPSFFFLVSFASPPAILSFPIVYPPNSVVDTALSFTLPFILFLNCLFLLSLYILLPFSSVPPLNTSLFPSLLLLPSPLLCLSLTLHADPTE